MSASGERTTGTVPNYDVKKARRELYSGKVGRFDLVTVPPMWFLSVPGSGDPNTADEYREAVEALYTVSYGVRALAKTQLGRTHTVGPLEGLWYAEDTRVFTARDKDAWRWTMMIAQPDWITAAMVDEATGRTTTTKPHVHVERVRFAEFAEGPAVQTLHVGPYDDEGPTIAHLHEQVIPGFDAVPTGHHHEIYLSDPRRSAPEKLRTILRQPVAVAS